MTRIDDIDYGLIDGEWSSTAEDPLAERLRTMEWVEVPAEVRDRCWSAISVRLGPDAGAPGAGDPDVAAAPPPGAGRTGEQYLFSRRATGRAPEPSQAGWRPAYARRRLSFS